MATNQNKIPLSERISSSFKQLASSSDDLNSAANDLGRSISALDVALSSLNLGVSAWRRIAGNTDDNGNYWSRDIGYTLVGGSWGIALRRTSGNEHADFHDEEVWPFNGAPRWMCIEGVGKVPDLFDELIKRTIESTEKIKARTGEAKELVAAIEAASSDLAAERKQPPKQGKKP